MSDPIDVLSPALKTWIETDTEVIAAFGGKPVKVFDLLPPTNEATPYVFLASAFVLDGEADCYDAAEVDLQVDVWSLTSPPGFTVARRIAKAVKAAIKRTEDTGDSPAFTISGHRVVAAAVVSTNYLTDPSDGKTVHAVIRATLSVDPID